VPQLRPMTVDTSAPIGAVLAGGIGRRIGGNKATIGLNGRPLIEYPVAAMRGAFEDVAVIAKADTDLPVLPGVTIWIERDEPRHPLAGIVRALELADTRPIFACAGDLPFVSSQLARLVADADAAGAVAIVPHAGGRLQPLFALYLPGARAQLAAALEQQPREPLSATVAALAPRVLELADERPFFNVNVPEDLLTAAGMLDLDERADREER
jgi:molybdopterin-guanine dinucleotide biosynthesis protein A